MVPSNATVAPHPLRLNYNWPVVWDLLLPSPADVESSTKMNRIFRFSQSMEMSSLCVDDVHQSNDVDCFAYRLVAVVRSTRLPYSMRLCLAFACNKCHQYVKRLNTMVAIDDRQSTIPLYLHTLAKWSGDDYCNCCLARPLFYGTKMERNFEIFASCILTVQTFEHCVVCYCVAFLRCVSPLRPCTTAAAYI